MQQLLLQKAFEFLKTHTPREDQFLYWEIDSMQDHVLNDQHGNLLAWITKDLEVYLNNQKVCNASSLLDAKKAVKVALLDLVIGILLLGEVEK